MGCDECKRSVERPCNGCNSCGNTPKVIQIDNPAEVVMFHKVIVPASMGDERDVPMTNGLYKNSLVVFQSNGHAFLYSSDGIPSRISFDSGAVLFVDRFPEASQATAGYLYISESGASAITMDNENWIHVSSGDTGDFELLNNRPKYDGKYMDRNTDIPNVDDAVAAEAALREAADNSLSLQLGDEIRERTTADNSLSTEIADEIRNRTDEDSALQSQIDDLDSKLDTEENTRFQADSDLEDRIAAEETARANADTAIENKLDRNVVTDIAIDTTASTTVVKLHEAKHNLKTGVASPEEVVFPVASTTQAGVVNSATFEAIETNSEDIASILGGAVMSDKLIQNPNQEQILAAWQLASGLVTPKNAASVWDNVNKKKYTYFSNHNTWELTQDGLGGAGVTVEPWTNDQAGIVKGSTNAGQVFAESDGTGSVNGWDNLRSDATVALQKATNNETEITKKQDILTAGDGIKIENNVITNTKDDLEWGKITGTLADQTDLQTELDKKIEAKDPIDVEEVESIISTDMIQDKAITTDKLNFDYITSIERLNTYLYKVSFNGIPEDDGTESDAGSCTSYVKDGKLYRNLDWNYDETISFHIKAKGFEGMSFISGVTNDNLDTKKIEQLPYHMVDGINDSGIMMAVHVLYNDWSWTKASANADIPLNVVGLRLLQNIKSMSDLDDFADDTLRYVKATPSMIASGYILQFVVTDGTTTKIITPPTADNQPYTIVDATANPKLTNFKWVADTNVERANLQTRPTGVERWNMLPLGMRELRFTKAYEAPDRLSEFIGINDTTKDTSDEVLTGIYNSAKALYDRHIRDGQTWQTMHSVVYSKRGMEELYIQENWDRDYAEHNVSMIYNGVEEPTNDFGKDGDIYVQYTEE